MELEGKLVVNAGISAIALPGREAHMGEKAISEDHHRPHLYQVSFLPSHSLRIMDDFI